MQNQCCPIAARTTFNIAGCIQGYFCDGVVRHTKDSSNRVQDWLSEGGRSRENVHGAMAVTPLPQVTLAWSASFWVREQYIKGLGESLGGWLCDVQKK